MIEAIAAGLPLLAVQDEAFEGMLEDGQNGKRAMTAAPHLGGQAGGAVSVNELAAQLLPRRPAGDDRPEEAALAHYLGLDEDDLFDRGLE